MNIAEITPRKNRNERDQMKIAVTSSGTSLDSEVDPRFGRAAYFLIVDPDTFQFEVVDNAENANSLKGAGISAAKTVCDKGANVLITGFCGPNAFKALKAANINVADNAAVTVRESLENYAKGKLPIADEPNAEGHW
jgi:predicted Fe-Mo cluster-binding NifX family protein